ncbi:MAG: YqgE/AlgH family protein [Flavobacteriales bacterium]|jgi:putative transcriptional regulator|nr:YqgE/AlgH family protein [Flavobacteriales bacterium]|tara:strand:- start:1197 stop:1805 length:609 start_codon:yes stop_codon:yes gene_type:complete
MEEIRSLFDFNSLNSLNLEKGRVIISDPFINDDYFSKSVILLCETNDKGAFGLVLNNYIDENLSDFMVKFKDVDCKDFKISLGGPVDVDSIYYIHTRPDLILDSIEVYQNIYLGNGENFDQIAELISNGSLSNNEIKFCLGYSGWTPGQLEEELERNSWFVGNVSQKSLMEYHESDLWKKTLEQMSEKHRVISNFPLNPMLN